MADDPSDPQEPLSAEDAKLVTLARATKARARAAQGASVRYLDGRTYAAASVDLERLSLSALEVCVAMALSSASSGLAAAVVLLDGEAAGVGEEVGAEVDVRAATDFAGPGVPVLV